MNINEFLSMSGYAGYVWSSFGLTFVMLVWQILQPIIENKSLQRSIIKRHLRKRQRS